MHMQNSAPDDGFLYERHTGSDTSDCSWPELGKYDAKVHREGQRRMNLSLELCVVMPIAGSSAQSYVCKLLVFPVQHKVHFE